MCVKGAEASLETFLSSDALEAAMTVRILPRRWFVHTCRFEFYLVFARLEHHMHQKVVNKFLDRHRGLGQSAVHFVYAGKHKNITSKCSFLNLQLKG